MHALAVSAAMHDRLTALLFHSNSISAEQLRPQSAALHSAKLAKVESRDQMAASILTAAGLELNHCNKHVNANDRFAILASLTRWAQLNCA